MCYHMLSVPQNTEGQVRGGTTEKIVGTVQNVHDRFCTTAQFWWIFFSTLSLWSASKKKSPDLKINMWTGKLCILNQKWQMKMLDLRNKPGLAMQNRLVQHKRLPMHWEIFLTTDAFGRPLALRTTSAFCAFFSLHSIIICLSWALAAYKHPRRQGAKR